MVTSFARLKALRFGTIEAHGEPFLYSRTGGKRPDGAHDGRPND